MESIDALAKAVNEFEGGLVLVSHDMRLIGQVAKEIWICDNKTITQYKGDIMNFKMEMRAQMGIEGGLRGDASTIAKDGESVNDKEEPKKPEAKVNDKEKPKKPEVNVEAVAPKAAAVEVKEEAPPPPQPIPPLVPEPPVPAPAAPAPAGGPPKNRYIPPHLRRKMQEQGSM